MSLFDKIVAAVTPPETEEMRRDATIRARELASRAPWLGKVLDHHDQIDAAFAMVKSASNPEQKRAKLMELGEILTAHSIAEEGVIYPALSDNGETGHATMAYTEQSAAKMQLGLLERMDPMSQDFTDKLEHLEGAVKHHVYEEESMWFPELVERATTADHNLIMTRYTEEFERYMSGKSASSMGGSTMAGGGMTESHTMMDSTIRN